MKLYHRAIFHSNKQGQHKIITHILQETKHLMNIPKQAWGQSANSSSVIQQKLILSSDIYNRVMF